MLTQTQREDLRLAVREVLVAAGQVAFPADVIARRVARLRILDFVPEVPEVEAALALLAGLVPAQVQIHPHALGATSHYQATAAGILAQERGS